MVEATISGSVLSGTIAIGSDTASFSGVGTATSLTGTFTLETGACAGIGGTFDLSR